MSYIDCDRTTNVAPNKPSLTVKVYFKQAKLRRSRCIRACERADKSTHIHKHTHIRAQINSCMQVVLCKFICVPE